MRVDLPSAMRNPISLIGVAVTTAMAVVFLLLLTLEFTGQLTNPYAGLLVFVAVPFVFVIGLLLIPIGIWRQHRRVAAGYAPDDWPVIDLRLPRTRSVIVGVALLTIVNVFIVSLAGFGAVHHMESTEFCGQTCHTTMEPEWKAHQASPHSKVACVGCHVGPGAAGFVEAKAAGTRQLWHVIINKVPTPVEAPVRSMPPARETCFGCHSGEGHQGDRLKVIRDYADDETGTETVTTLQMHVGGVKPASGIHWHIAQQIEYIATDRERQTIPYVKFTDRDGNVKEYTVDGTKPEQLAQGERRSMDCMDCHNRPAHTFDPSPERAVDIAIADGAPAANAALCAARSGRGAQGRVRLRRRGAERHRCAAAQGVCLACQRSGARSHRHRGAGHLRAKRVPGDESEVGHLSEQHRPHVLQRLFPLSRRQSQGQRWLGDQTGLRDLSCDALNRSRC